MAIQFILQAMYTVLVFLIGARYGIHRAQREIDKAKDRPACEGDCKMNYCDENGCIERKRTFTEPCDIDKEKELHNASND